jgi:hypothetical protein
MLKSDPGAQALWEKPPFKRSGKSVVRQVVQVELTIGVGVQERMGVQERS